MRSALALLLVAGAALGAGCGEAKVPVEVVGPGAHEQRRAHTQPGTGPAASAKPSAGTKTSTGAQPAPGAHVRPGTQTPLTASAVKHRAVVARVDVASDAALAEGKVHIAQGAPSDAEVRREVQTLRKAGIVLPSGDTAASFANAQANSNIYAQGAETPDAVWNPRLKPIAAWIIPVLEWAYQHGWRGTVTSGYRTYLEQAALNTAGAFSAPAGASNHETTAYPGGAVDVTNPSQLLVVLHGYPGAEKLVGGVLGPVDPEHFSATGY